MADAEQRAMDAQYEAEMLAYDATIRDDIAKELTRKALRGHKSEYPRIFAEIAAAKAILAVGDQNALLTAYLRTYRAIDHYQNVLHHAIVDALIEPFSAFIANATPRTMLQDGFIRGVRAKVLREAFQGDEFPARLKSFFESPQAKLRNDVFHGLYVPRMEDVRKLIADAKGVLRAAERGTNPHLAVESLEVP